MIALLRRCWRCTEVHVQANAKVYTAGGTTAALMVVTLDAAKDILGSASPGYANAAVIVALLVAKSKALRDFNL